MRIISPLRATLALVNRALDQHRGRFRLAFLAGLAIILVMTSVQYVEKIAKPGDSGLQSRSAFLRWRTMIRDMFTGANVYVGVNEYPNPPVMAIVLRPFVELPPMAGALAWFYAKAAMAVLAAIWLFRLIGGSGYGSIASMPTSKREHVSDPAMAAAILLALPAVIGDLTHNNVNLFILFLIAGCLELYRRGYDLTAGLVLGLAAACKVTPLLFLAYFVWKRAGRAVVGCLAGLVLWLALVPGTVFGWDRNEELLTDWYRLMIERPVLKGEVTTEHANQALPGVVYRLFTRSPSYIEYIDRGPEGKFPSPAAYHNLLDIGRPTAWWVVKALSVAFVLLVMWSCRTPRQYRQGWRFATECGIVLLGMLLFSERTWKHHAVTLLLPAAVIAHMADRTRDQGRRRWLFGIVVGAGALISLPGLFGQRAGEFGMIYGLHTLAYLLLLGGCFWLLADDVFGLDGTDGMDTPVAERNGE